MKRFLYFSIALILFAGCTSLPVRAQSWTDIHAKSVTLAGNGTDIVDGLKLLLAPNTAGGLTWTLPASNGTSGYVLTTNGSGTLSWSAPGGGGGGGINTVIGLRSIWASVSGDTLTLQTTNFIDDGTFGLAGVVSGSRAIVAGGDVNRAGAPYSAVVGGFFNATYGSNPAGSILGGSTDTVSRAYSAAIGGQNLKTAWDNHVVVGMFNDTDIDAGSNAYFSVGNGADELHRHSAFEVGASGNIYADQIELFDAGANAIPVSSLSAGADGDILTTASGLPTWVTPGTTGATSGGTGLSSYALGDMLAASATNTLSVAPGNTTTTKKFLTQTGTGTVSAMPTWGTIAESDVTNLATDLASAVHKTGTETITGAKTFTPSTTSDVAISVVPSGSQTGDVVMFADKNSNIPLEITAGGLSKIGQTQFTPYVDNTAVSITTPIGFTANRLVVSDASVSPIFTVDATGVTTVKNLTISALGSGIAHVSSGGVVSSSGISATTDVTGTLPVANGGTGQASYTDGQLLIGNTTGNTLAKATLTAGSGISITNGSGTITIAGAGISGATKLLFYGDGTDGAVALDGVNTFPFASLVGTTYTLTRSVFATTFTTSGSVTIKANYPIYATTSITNGSGCTMQSNGANATAGSAGALSTGLFAGTLQGAAGSSSISNGVPGAGASVSYGGSGGAGGVDGHAHTGGIAGVAAAPAATVGSIHGFPMMYFGGNFSGLTWWRGGASGGSGANNCSGCSISGAGGNGGGTLGVYSPTVTNNGTMSANGGNGGTCAQVADAGGGGGGGGGLVIIVCNTFSGTTPVALGGTHGNGVGTGANGGDGQAGSVFEMQMQ